MAGGLPTNLYRELGFREGASPTYSADMDGDSSVRWLSVDWANVAEAGALLLGFSVVNQAGRLERYLPDRHPRKPNLFACRVLDSTGLGGVGYEVTPDGKSNTYRQALLKVEYSWRPYNVLEPQEMPDPLDEYYRFVELVPYGDVSYVSPPGFQFLLRFAENNPPAGPNDVLNANVGKLLPSSTITLRWHQVPYGGLRDDSDYRGRVNKFPLGNINFDPLTYFKEGTLLYLGRSFRRHGMPFNYADPFMDAVDVDYRFMHQPFGFNKYPHFQRATRTPREPVTFDLATVSGNRPLPGQDLPDGDATYDEKDLKELFKVTS